MLKRNLVMVITLTFVLGVIAIKNSPIFYESSTNIKKSKTTYEKQNYIKDSKSSINKSNDNKDTISLSDNNDSETSSDVITNKNESSTSNNETYDKKNSSNDVKNNNNDQTNTISKSENINSSINTDNQTRADSTQEPKIPAIYYDRTTSIYENDYKTLIRVEYYLNNKLTYYSSVEQFDSITNSYIEKIYNYNFETDTENLVRTDVYSNGSLIKSY